MPPTCWFQLRRSKQQIEVNRLHTLFHGQWLCGQPCLKPSIEKWSAESRDVCILHMFVWYIGAVKQSEAFACTEDQASVSGEANVCLSTSQTDMFNLPTSTCLKNTCPTTDASSVFITLLTSPFFAVSKHQRLISLSSSSINQPEPFDINELKKSGTAAGTVNCCKSLKKKVPLQLQKRQKSCIIAFLCCFSVDFSY